MVRHPSHESYPLRLYLMGKCYFIKHLSRHNGAQNCQQDYTFQCLCVVITYYPCTISDAWREHSAPSGFQQQNSQPFSLFGTKVHFPLILEIKLSFPFNIYANVHDLVVFEVINSKLSSALSYILLFLISFYFIIVWNIIYTRYVAERYLKGL